MLDPKEWITEKHQNASALSFRCRKKLFSGQSPLQKVEIYETQEHGRVLLNDGCFMLSERDEAIYHEMMTHVPLFTHPDPRRILIIGGGDGGTAREVLRHSNVQRVVMVEIDAMVVEACREHIPQTAQALEDPRLELIIADGVEFVRHSQESFDVILVDSTDPVGPAQPLFGKEFYADIFSRLSEEGIVVAQGESPFYETSMQKTLLEIMGELFPLVRPYNFSNLTYPGGLWSFMFASKGPHPLKDFAPEKLKSQGLEFFYYNGEIHCSSFALPQFMRQNLGAWIKTGDKS